MRGKEKVHEQHEDLEPSRQTEVPVPLQIMKWDTGPFVSSSWTNPPRALEANRVRK